MRTASLLAMATTLSLAGCQQSEDGDFGSPSDGDLEAGNDGGSGMDDGGGTSGDDDGGTGADESAEGTSGEDDGTGDVGDTDDGEDDPDDGEDEDSGGDTDDGEDDSGDEADDGDETSGDDGEDGDEDTGDDADDGDEDSGGNTDDGEDDSGGEDSGNEDGSSDGGGSEDSGDDGGDGSDGCGMSYPGGDHTLTIDVAGSTRQFLLIVPENYDRDKSYPLLFTLHGINGNGPELRAAGFTMESQANGEAIHIFPDGLQERWDLSANGIDVQYFDALVEWASENLCINPDRIFVFGYSMGGMFSNLLGCVRGDVIRAVGPAEGNGPRGGNCVGEVAAILAHGTDDPVVSYDSGVQSRDFWLEANGCGTTTQPFDVEPCVIYEDCNAGSPVVWCEHSGMGHRPPNYFPEAGWAFFSQL